MSIHTQETLKTFLSHEYKNKFDSILPGLYAYIEEMVVSSSWNKNLQRDTRLADIFVPHSMSAWYSIDEARRAGFLELGGHQELLQAIQEGRSEAVQKALQHCRRWSERELKDTTETLLL